MPKETMPVYLESGQKRVFAGAIAWPGLTRSGTTAEEAIAALLAAAPRYASALARVDLAFALPGSAADFAIRERLPGDATTDFGAPSAIPSADQAGVDEPALAQLQAILRASWAALDAAAASAAGRELRKGPRGGGRDLEKILEHVRGGQDGYLSRIGAKVSAADPAAYRSAVLAALAASAHGEVPATGPRGGTRWPARYFTRRAAWHILDHAWEIEDRVS